MTELDRYKAALTYALGELQRMHAGSGSRVRSEVDKIINPPPEFETVEESVWKVYRADGSLVGIYEMKQDLCNGWSQRELTGTHQRPKQPPLERSVSVGARIKNGGEAYGLDHPCPFREHPEINGKSGTLTFTWTEQA